MILRAVILILWFVAAALPTFAGLSLYRGFLDWEGGLFDKFGPGWILLKSIWYGLVACLVGGTIMLRFGRVKFAWAPLIAVIVMVVADQIPGDQAYQRSLVDRLIDWTGYQCFLLAPSSPKDLPVPSGLSPVLPPNIRIEAQTPRGTIAITTGNGLLRTYEWDGTKRSLQLLPPDAGKLNGQSFHSTQFGPDGVRIPSYDWPEHQGISRADCTETRRDFQSLNEAADWLEGQTGDNTLPAVWTNNGLVVAWSTGMQDKSLTIKLTQIFIKGKKPSHLPGSQDGKFIIRSL
jgi:hypothetical protein